MFLDIGVNIALITITIFFLAVALVLLNLNKEFGRNKTQGYIIAALFIYELFSYILLGIDAGIYYGTDLYNNRIVSIIVGEFFNVFTTLVYYTLMVLLVLDRFLVFYLNIKYPLYCTTLNLLKVVISFVLLLFLTFILVAVLRVTELLQRRTHFWIFYTSFLILDLCYFLFVAFSYTYIFLVYQRQVKKNKQIVWRERKDRFKLLIPSLIILSFLLFNILPDFIVTIRNICSLPISTELNSALQILYRIGFLMDPVIYTANFICAVKERRHKKRKIEMMNYEQNKTIFIME